MENRTEIGNAIKSKLEHLDKTPSDFVWSKIETDLNKKRKRKIVFWAIPSIIALLLFSTSFYFYSNFQDKNKREETKTAKEVKTKNSKSIPESYQYPAHKLNFVQIKQKPDSEEIITIKKSKTIKLIKQSSKLITSTKEYQEYEVVKKYKVIVKTDHIITKPIIPSTAKKVTKHHTRKKLSSVRKINKPVKKNAKKTSQTHKSGKSKKSEKELESSEIPLKKINNEDPLKNDNIPNEPLNIETEVDSVIKIDSLNLKKNIKKREYKKTNYENPEDELNSDLTISVLYGPAIFGSLNNKSLINPAMDNLGKTHPITSQYGVYVKTMFNRIGFRTGFSKINLKITTRLDQNVLIPSYNNVDIKNQVNIKETFSGSNNVDLIQKLSYYEFPIAFDYAIKKDESKIGIDAFTGFSFLFLDKNELYMESEKVSRQNIGEVKNISGVNISYDLGIELNYKLTNRFTISINPLFKYYLNTFKENIEVKPYSFSLQSGIGYKF
ncbi:MAG: hypothetical protein ABI441_16995 [Flavobacterium sp.]